MAPHARWSRRDVPRRRGELRALVGAAARGGRAARRSRRRLPADGARGDPRLARRLRARRRGGPGPRRVPRQLPRPRLQRHGRARSRRRAALRRAARRGGAGAARTRARDHRGRRAGRRRAALELLRGPDAGAAAPDAWRPLPASERDAGTVLFTSGTTGPSKAVLVSNGQLRATADGRVAGRDARAGRPLLLDAAALPRRRQAGGRRGAARRRAARRARALLDPRVLETTCAGRARRHVSDGRDGRLPDGAARARRRCRQRARQGAVLPLPRGARAFRRRFGVRVRTLYNQTEISVPIASPGFDTAEPRSCGRRRRATSAGSSTSTTASCPPARWAS